MVIRNFSSTRFSEIRARLEAYEPKTPFGSSTYEFLLFGFKQAWACFFGAILLALMLGTHLFYPSHALVERYDFLFICAVLLQIAMLALRLETLEEARVILAFHLVGTAMEIFKTSVGSWVYPEPSTFHVAGVPLFSGFMYAAVGSYIARIWRIFGFSFVGYPNRYVPIVLAVAIYINFFSHHFVPDIRWLLFALTAAVFGRTWVYFRPWRIDRRMPLLLGFLLVALFIWLAENIATYSRAWIYPHQESGWSVVPPEKLGAWLLLMIISFVLVSVVHER